MRVLRASLAGRLCCVGDSRLGGGDGVVGRRVKDPGSEPRAPTAAPPAAQIGERLKKAVRQSLAWQQLHASLALRLAR